MQDGEILVGMLGISHIPTFLGIHLIVFGAVFYFNLFAVNKAIICMASPAKMFGQYVSVSEIDIPL